MAEDDPASAIPESLFADVPSSIKSLRKYWKDRTFPDPTKWNDQIDNESDRSYVVILATMVDDALAVALSKKFCFSPNDDQFDWAFRYEGPMGSFSNRIEIAALFGVIDDTTLKQLTALREMRNACAHSKHRLTLEDSELYNVAKRIIGPTGEILYTGPMKSEPLRIVIHLEVQAIIFCLRYGSRQKGLEVFRKKCWEAAVAIGALHGKFPTEVPADNPKIPEDDKPQAPP